MNPDVDMNDVFKVVDGYTLRFLRVLPVLVGFCLTLYVRYFAASRSVKVWRALQVYDSQVPPKKGFHGLKKMTKLEKYLRWAFVVVPMAIHFIVTLPIELIVSWPWFTKLRRSMPYVMIAILGYLTFSCIFVPFVLPLKTVQRDLQSEKDKITKAGSVFIRNTLTDRKVNRAKMMLYGSVLVPICLAYYCSTYANPVSILVVIAFLTSYLSLSGLCIPSDNKLSIRRRLGDAFVGLGAFIIILLTIYGFKIGIDWIVENYASKDFNGQFEWEKMKKDPYLFVTSQALCILYTSLWSQFMCGPAELMGMAYRFDMDRFNPIEVEDQIKSLALVESQKVAKQNQLVLKRQSHPFDNLGRTPILLEADALRWELSDEVGKIQLPTFDAAFKTMIAIQAICFLIGLGPISSLFNVPYFIKTEEEASLFVLAFSINLSAIIGYLCLPPVMLISAGLTARRNGAKFSSGVRRLWSYEEIWSADYHQAPFDHGTDMEDSIELNEDEEAKEEDGLIIHKREEDS